MFVSGSSISTVDESIVNDREGLLRLAEDWNRLAERAMTPLVSHEWFLACAEAFCPPFEVSVFTVKNGQSIHAIAPCASRRTFAGPRLEILGASFHREPTGILYDSMESLESLLLKVMAQRRPMQLIRMPKDDAVDTMIRTICQREGYFLASHETTSPWLGIDSSWETFESRMSANNRSSLKRYWKKAKQNGNASVEFNFVPPEEVEQYLQLFARVEAASWKSKKGTAIEQMPKVKSFFSMYALAMALQGSFVAGVLRVDNTPVAVKLGIIHANRFWSLKVGYDESWWRISPGILLHHESIRWAFEQGLEGYEFLGYDEPWIHKWTDRLHHYTSYYIYPKSLAGLAHLWMDVAEVAGRKLSEIEWNKWKKS